MIQTPFLLSPPTPPVASWRSLTYGIVALAPSLFISRLGWVGMKVTDTALLGHVGTHALAASSLSDLWTMACGAACGVPPGGNCTGNCQLSRRAHEGVSCE